MKPPMRARGLFPIPLVGAATILFVLILLTPILITSGVPAAGTIFTQAELVVDHPTGNSTTNFYLHAIGNVRYAYLSIGFAQNYNWDNPPPIQALVWGNWTNGTNLVAISAESLDDPIAVNVSAYYATAKEGNAWYVAILGFEVVDNTMFLRSYTSGVDVPRSVSLSGAALPLPILLADVGSGGP